MMKIGITGHRQFANPEKVRIDIINAIRYLSSIDKEIIGYTQLATGSDTIFASVLSENNIPYVAVLPVAVEIYRKGFIKDDCKLLDKYLKNAKSVTIINKDTDTQPTDNDYLNAGIFTVDNSDVIIGVWDGEKSPNIGGTYDILSYALNKGKEVHIIKGHREKENIHINSEIEGEYDNHDNLAIKHKLWFGLFWKTGLVLANAALFILLIGIFFVETYDLKFILSIVETFTILISFFCLVWGANHFKTKFVTHRAKAEQFRILCTMRESGLEFRELNRIKLKNEEDFSIFFYDIQNSTNQQVMDNIKRLLWILTDDQVRYHRLKRLPDIKRRLNQNKSILNVLKISFVIIVVLKLLSEIALHFHVLPNHTLELIINVIDFLIIFIPGVYATVEGVIHFNSWNSHIEKSERIIIELSALKNKLVPCSDMKTLLPMIEDIVNILSNESQYWKDKVESKKVEISI